MKNLIWRFIFIKPFLTTFFIIFFGCENDNVIYNQPHKDLSNDQSYGELFEVFWMKMNDNYLFWNIDETDWDKVYRNYKNKFDKLSCEIQKNDLSRSQARTKAADMFKEITGPLLDGHLNITGLGGELKFTPSIERWKQSSGYYKISDKYFACRNHSSGICKFLDEGSILDAPCSRSKSLLATLKGGEILYFSFRKFYQYEDSMDSISGKAINEFLKKIEKGKQAYKGLIIDVRSNTGGSVEDLRFLLSRFADKTSPNFFTRYKASSARLSYGPWIPDLSYYDNNQQFPDFTTVLLVDRNSMSMAEIAAIVFSKNPKTIVIGDRTFGALGCIAPADPYGNGGIYTIGKSPMNLRIYNPVTQLKGYDGRYYEGEGVLPEIVEKINLAHVNKFDSNHEIKSLSKDDQLERAVKYLERAVKYLVDHS